MITLCEDILMLILSWIPLRVSSAVCKRCRQVLLLDRMAIIRARLPTATIKEIIDLPTIFHDTLTMTQQLLLPNELFENADVTIHARDYSTYKFQPSWADVRGSEYIGNILHAHAVSDIKTFPRGYRAYFKHLFIHSIQYRHYVTALSGISTAMIIEHMGANRKARPVRLINLSNCIWDYGECSVKYWSDLIFSDHSYARYTHE